MFLQLAARIREQVNPLIAQYDERLRAVPGYANLPEPARRDLEQRVLQLMADCLETNNDQMLIDYIHERARQVLASGFDPEWFRQAVTIPQDIITPLVETVDESNFVWRTLGHAQTTAWEIVAHERHRIELTLRESEARYQTIFDATPIMFWLKDTNNRTLRINKAAAELEGVKPADVEGKSAYDLYPREQAEAFYQDDLEVIRTNRSKLGIVEQHTSVGTGKLMWVETGKTPVHNDQGETVGVLAFAIDITERKEAEEALRRSAEQQRRTTHQLQAALEATRELIQAGDLDTLYRRAVELAREKLNIERCGLYMFDESRDYLWGTYGTDDQRRTTDERSAQRTADEFAAILTARSEQLWVVRETPHVYVAEGVQHTVGSGWVVGTVLHGTEGPIGILFNDSALSGRPVDEAQQESLAIYCSIIGPIIERKRLEEQAQQSLTRRSIQVRTSTEVAQEIASAADLNDLFKRVVTLIRERFNYYHAQLFRYEPAQDAVVLITGYGEIGQKMLETGHKLQMGRGVVGAAAATGQSILATDVRQDTDWRSNPSLPETKGELAVPIKWRDQVLGILDVQSDQAGALTDDDRLLLEGLCGQIASAMESTRLLEALRRNEAELSEALKIAKLGYWEYDVEKDLFLFNDQFYSIFHTTVEQAGGYQLSSAQYAQQFVHPDDLPLVGTEIEKALNSTDRHYNRQLEHRILYADGGIGYISVSVNIDRDEQGRILRYYGANQDITERKQIEEALSQEQSLMRALMDSVTDHIYFKDLQSRFLRISKSQADRFGLSDQAQAMGKTDFDFFTEEHARPAYEDEQEIIRTGQSISKEECETWADRPDTWVLTTKFPLRNEAGNIVGTFGRSFDITERKQAEAEHERLLAEQRQRAVQLQTASEVSRAASSILNIEELLPQVADLVCDRFNFYYVGIFLTDDTERWAILRAGTGEAGQRMLANGHKLKIGGNSMISQCILNQQAQIALDVGEEAVRFDNPLLPLTRSEMALPLISRGGVIGAVTIQSDQPAAFTADDITVLQSMADQISNAVDNARLYEQAQTALQEVDAINRRLTGEAWETYLRQQVGREVIWLADDESTAPESLPQLDEQLTTGEIAIEPDPQDESEATVTVPILLRGQPIGALRLRTPLAEWNDDTETMLAEVAGHIAQAVENARLVEQTQRTAQRERLINEINARVRQTVTIDSILETAVKELGKSLAATHVFARLGQSAPLEDIHERMG